MKERGCERERGEREGGRYRREKREGEEIGEKRER